MPDELWMEVCDIVQETGIKTILMEKKCKKVEWLSGEALQIAVNGREASHIQGYHYHLSKLLKLKSIHLYLKNKCIKEKEKKKEEKQKAKEKRKDISI